MKEEEVVRRVECGRGAGQIWVWNCRWVVSTKVGLRGSLVTSKKPLRETVEGVGSTCS